MRAQVHGRCARARKVVSPLCARRVRSPTTSNDNNNFCSLSLSFSFKRETMSRMASRRGPHPAGAVCKLTHARVPQWRRYGTAHAHCDDGRLLRGGRSFALTCCAFTVRLSPSPLLPKRRRRGAYLERACVRARERQVHAASTTAGNRCARDPILALPPRERHTQSRRAARARAPQKTRTPIRRIRPSVARRPSN